MEPIVFAPDCGAGFLVGFGTFVFSLGVLGAALMARKHLRYETTGLAPWSGVGGLLALGGVLVMFPSSEARGLTIVGDRMVLLYHWPHPDRELDARQIKAARIELRGTKHPSPRLVIDTEDGETIEGEGTSNREHVERAKAVVDDLVLKR